MSSTPNTIVPTPEFCPLVDRDSAWDKAYQIILQSAGDRYAVNFGLLRQSDVLLGDTKTPLPFTCAIAQGTTGQVSKDPQFQIYFPGFHQMHGKPQGEQVNSSLKPLLDPIDAVIIPRLLADALWWMQEKHKGQPVLIRKDRESIIGLNQHGLRIHLPAAIQDGVEAIPGQFLIEGNCVGEVCYAFDLHEINRQDLRPEPYERRFCTLQSFMEQFQSESIRVHPVATTTSQ